MDLGRTSWLKLQPGDSIMHPGDPSDPSDIPLTQKLHPGVQPDILFDPGWGSEEGCIMHLCFREL